MAIVTMKTNWNSCLIYRITHISRTRHTLQKELTISCNPNSARFAKRYLAIVWVHTKMLL